MRRSDGFLLEIKEISKSFGGLVAVKDFSLGIEQAQIISLIGPNGAGKTTLFNVLTGITKPDRGMFALEGKKLTGMPAHKIAQQGIARTFQELKLFDDMSVIDNLLIAFKFKHGEKFLSSIFRRKKIKRETEAYIARARKLLKIVNLEQNASQPAGELSYGQRKLVEIVRTLAANPKLVLLDEPTAGVNPQLFYDISMLFRKLVTDGVTIFIIEHNIDFVMEISDKVAVMDGGKRIAFGTPEEVRNSEQVKEAYLGLRIE